MRKISRLFLSFCIAFLCAVWLLGWQTQAGTVQESPRPRGDLQEAMEPSIRQEVVSLEAQDGGTSWGILNTPRDKTPQTAVISMHPAGSGRNRLLAPLAQAGFAALGQINRYGTDKTFGIHEKMLLDIAAGINFLKSRGFRKIVLLGSSGGGPLMIFYQAQAATEPPGRVSSTPSGNPPNLNKFDLPAADGVLTVVPHLGEGNILQARIDPSVLDEGDSLSVDSSLDLYNPLNGFRMPPETTTYSKEFVTRYRAAQRAYTHRLDQRARALIAEQDHYRQLTQLSDFKDFPPEQRQWIERNANTERMMVIHRQWADLRYMDLTIDPSDRVVGDNYGTTPWNTNYTRDNDKPSYVSPRAFLSSRSSISSNAATLKNVPKVQVPFGIIQGTAHRAIYPSDTKAIFEAAGAEDKKLMWIVGADVRFQPSGPKAGKGDQLQQSVEAAVSWMLERFPH